MGDFAHSRFTIAEADLKRVRTLILEGSIVSLGTLGDEEVHGDGTVSFVEVEANYGGDYIVDELANEQIPVVVEHRAGDAYPSGQIAFDGKERASHITSDGKLAVPFSESLGGVEEEALAQARSFVRLRERALAAMRSR